jgi:hypothetical protein
VVPCFVAGRIQSSDLFRHAPPCGYAIDGAAREKNHIASPGSSKTEIDKETVAANFYRPSLVHIDRLQLSMREERQ